MALNEATLALILCRQVKTIKHGSVRINIVHFPIPCFLNFLQCRSYYIFFIFQNDFSTCSCPFVTTCMHYNLLSLLPRNQHGQVLLLKHAHA